MRFNIEVDNFDGKHVKDMVIGPMIDGTNQLMGVVNLVNRQELYDFDEVQQARLQKLLTVFAECVRNANDFHDIWSLSYGYV